MSVVAGVALDVDRTPRPRGVIGSSRPSRGRRHLYPVSVAAGRCGGLGLSARSRYAADIAASPSRSWRLTRRGRLVVLGLLLILLTVGTVGFGAARALNASTAPADRQVQVVVAEGDTLWTIAADVAPRANRAETVDRIREANHLRGNHIEPGQQLVVPVVAP